MRKSLLTLMAGVFCTAFAFSDNPLVISEADFDLIPATAANPNAAFSFYNEEEDGSTTFTIYDESFNRLKEFSVPEVTTVSSSYRWYPEVVGIKKATVTKQYVIEEYSSMTPEEVCKALKESFPDDKTRIYTLDNGTIIIGDNFAQYGIIKANAYYVLEDGEWYRADVEYDMSDTVTEYLPENRTEYEAEGTLYPTHTIVLNAEGGDPGYYRVTRGIYSKDFTYVLPETELVVFPEQIRDDGVKYGQSRSMIKGFTIYNVDGSKISTITLPEGFFHNPYDNDIDYVSTAGKNYIMVRLYKMSISDEFSNPWTSYGYAIYSLDISSRATQIAIAPASRISPRAPKKGDIVTVTVDDRFAGEKCLVNVVSADGRNMLQEEINPGQKEINFNTSRFPQGVYVVTIAGKTQKIETAKIIVR